MHYSAWNPAKGELDDAVLSTADAIVNLAGANVGQRWTASHKKAIIDSRLDSTGLLVQAAQKHPRIQVMVSASAIGLYADSPEVQSVKQALWSKFKEMPIVGYHSIPDLPILPLANGSG